MLKAADIMEKSKENMLVHATKMVVDGIPFPQPIHPKDVERIRAQCRANPSRLWPSRLAMEWDITEGLAKRFLKGKM
jgi:hypothetical protein